MELKFITSETEARGGYIHMLDDGKIDYYCVTLDVEINTDTEDDDCLLSIDAVDEDGEVGGAWVNLTVSEAISLRNQLNTYIEMVFKSKYKE